MTRILMVCMGNICRSPMAEAVGRNMARRVGMGRRFVFDSAGTHPAGNGARPDPRAVAALELNGYKIVRHRARGLIDRDFERCDLILAMDHVNLGSLRRVCPVEQSHKLSLFLDFAPGLAGQEVPDPYYGNAQGFAHVLELCEFGARGLLATLAGKGT